MSSAHAVSVGALTAVGIVLYWWLRVAHERDELCILAEEASARAQHRLLLLDEELAVARRDALQDVPAHDLVLPRYGSGRVLSRYGSLQSVLSEDEMECYRSIESEMSMAAELLDEEESQARAA
jgi:hypothetical protein